MIEVYRDRDYSKVALIQGVLESEGIKTMLRNGNAVTMTTEIPIPVMFPNICLFDQADLTEAKQLIDAFLNAPEPADLPKWKCRYCGESNESQFSECWSCQHQKEDLEQPDDTR